MAALDKTGQFQLLLSTQSIHEEDDINGEEQRRLSTKNKVSPHCNQDICKFLKESAALVPVPS